MVIASSCCHCQVISQSLECWSGPTALPPHLAPTVFVIIRRAGSFSPGFHAECCSSPCIHSCQHFPVLLAEVLSGEREIPLVFLYCRRKTGH